MDYLVSPLVDLGVDGVKTGRTFSVGFGGKNEDLGKDLPGRCVVYIFYLTLSSSSDELYLLMLMRPIGDSASGLLKKLFLLLLKAGTFKAKCQ